MDIMTEYHVNYKQLVQKSFFDQLKYVRQLRERF